MCMIINYGSQNFMCQCRQGLAVSLCWWYQVAQRPCVGLTKLSCPCPFVGHSVECGGPALVFFCVLPTHFGTQDWLVSGQRET